MKALKLKKMSSFKNTYFLTTFEGEGKLRCNDCYYLLNRECMTIIRDIKLGIKKPIELKNYISEKYKVFNWLFVLEDNDAKDIKEYAFTGINIDNKQCYAFDVFMAFHF